MACQYFVMVSILLPLVHHLWYTAFGNGVSAGALNNVGELFDRSWA